MKICATHEITNLLMVASQITQILMQKGLRMIYQMDQKLFMMLYKKAESNRVLRSFMRGATLLSSKVFAVIYGLYILTLSVSRDERLLPFLIGPALSLLFVSLVRRFFKRKRPFETMDIEPFVSHEIGGSFPSKHTSSAFVIAASILFINPLVGWIALALALLTGISRIMVGVHYPLDIFGGMVIGLIFSCVAFRVL